MSADHVDDHESVEMLLVPLYEVVIGKIEWYHLVKTAYLLKGIDIDAHAAVQKAFASRRHPSGSYVSQMKVRVENLTAGRVDFAMAREYGGKKGGIAVVLHSRYIVREGILRE